VSLLICVPLVSSALDVAKLSFFWILGVRVTIFFMLSIMGGKFTRRREGH
jgi:hypothetical protein